jgi:hypothetical protein
MRYTELRRMKMEEHSRFRPFPIFLVPTNAVHGLPQPTSHQNSAEFSQDPARKMPQFRKSQESVR